MTDPEFPPPPESLDSAAVSTSFYAELGAAGLAERTTAEWDQEILGQLATLLQPGERVADVGCGYGRIAIPLARRGVRVTGLDLSANLLAAARASALQLGVQVDWVQASMCRIPLADGSFDAAICLWSAFYELLTWDEQLAALSEMHRILRPGGRGLIEGPVYTAATADELAAGQRHGPDGRLASDWICGLLNMHFRHDAATFADLTRAANIAHYEVYLAPWGGRPRQFLRWEKR